MRRRHIVLISLFVACSAAFGCNGAAPTEPGRLHLEAADRGPAAADLGIPLSGLWAGTITFSGYDSLGSDSFPPPCDGPHPMSVVLHEDGDAVTGRFQSCAGTVEIDARISETSLSGTMGVFGKISGGITNGRIQFRTIETVVVDDNDSARHSNGDGHFISSTVSLSRASMVERSSPVPADAGRSTRQLGRR